MRWFGRRISLCYVRAAREFFSLFLTPINGISALTKLFFARKRRKIISYLLKGSEGAKERELQVWGNANCA